ncbi:MAG: Omp28-related outer membrane protein [Crocinitomicaceae bacterium]|nr:Omp28-related outer membrane protein [Crocinitomicaceae bacterium]
MKNLLFALAISLVGFTACDKVENTMPDGPGGPDNCGWSAYPNGDSAHYVANAWPTFTENTNTDRNILIEDFIGHQCIFCSAAADLAHQLYLDNPGRVFVSSIHAGPSGQIEGNQEVNPAGGFIEDFTCEEGITLGHYFGGQWPGSPFQGNPNGAISRVDHGNGFPITSPSQWENATNSMIAANNLKVNIQAANNYYPSTRGVFLHTEIEVVDQSLTNELRIVVHLMEDSLVGYQSTQSSYIPDFVHRDIMRGSIDGKAFGEVLDALNLDPNGKHYVNYIYCLPDEYDENNVHLLIYVRDAVTEEVYQVIKQTL